MDVGWLTSYLIQDNVQRLVLELLVQPISVEFIPSSPSRFSG